MDPPQPMDPEEEPNTPYVLEIPAGFPSPIIPTDNELTKSRIELGKKLFYDERMSRTESISCGTCHLPNKGFTDGLPKSLGVEDRVNRRNSIGLANVAWQERLLREGGVPSLEQQVLVPFQEHSEFDFNMLLAIDRLSMDSDLQQLAEEAYGRALDPYVITRAIASFQRTLISGNSPFDKWQYQGDRAALSSEQERGWGLFQSLGCGSCHSAPLFTDQSFRNNGLYAVYPDSGRWRLTYKTEDIGVFKVPSLRNVSLTGPYMHDGSLSTLSEVIDHYAAGGKGHWNQDAAIAPLSMDTSDKAALLAFLEGLTDRDFITNPDFRP